MLRIRLAVTVILLLALVACTTSHSKVARTTARSTPTSNAASPVSSSPAASSQPTTAVPSTTPPIATATESPAVDGDDCATANLRLAFLGGVGAGGTSFGTYGLTNIGATTCTMIGYPGVSILNAEGAVVQHPAIWGQLSTHPSVAVALVTLAPTQTATFLTTSSDNTPNSSCPIPFTGVQLRVYPPNQTTALYLADPESFCDLGVGPVALKQ